MKDNQGKTPIHHVVNPLIFGSFENVRMLEELAKFFGVNEKDNDGRSPLYCARLKNSGIMAQKLLEPRSIDDFSKVKNSLSTMTSLLNWPPEVNFVKDSEDYLKKIAELDMTLEEKYRVLPDDAANRQNPEVVYHVELGPYSLYMTKVDIKSSFYGENLFYHMQVLYEKNCDIYLYIIYKMGKNS